MANAKVIDKKQQLVDQLKEKIEKARVLVISDYRGVTVSEITGLRRKLLKEKSEFKIVKNTLLQRALAASGFTDLDQHLSGPTAILFGYQDPIAPIKLLVEYVEEIEKGQVKGGIVERRVVDIKGIAALSKLPPKEVLIAKVIGGFKSPLYGLVNVLQGNIRKLVYVFNAVKDKKSS
ncbi:50S ribosomal protein L10 [Candidatus Saganbacteria bacterium]|nr:50S ribosomal protein L10 [Candidatus Saganbacteria bacterium]